MTEIQMEPNKNENSGNITQAQQILSLIDRSKAVLFHDEFNEPYARVRVDDHFELCKIRSRNFTRWLTHRYWGKFNQVPNKESLNSACSVIEARACFEGEKHNLHNRTASHDGSIWYDLGNWKAVKVSSDGWEIINDPPILFRTYSHQKAQAEPVRCPSYEFDRILEELSSLINIKDENQKLLFIVNLICSFIPDIPHPIDVLHGDQGTAKTTTSTIKKELVDPSELKNLRFSNNYEQFVQQASHHWHIPLDNLTSLPGWFSDTLCRVVTGEGFSKRELYTNDEDVIYSFKRCVTINGINMVPSKPDILDRSLIFEFETIPQSKRIDEALFWERFNEMKAQILGAIFSSLSNAMKIHPDVKLSSKPRMADFAQWGAAIAVSIGRSKEDFMQAYKENIDIQNTEALEANPISRVVTSFMQDKEIWSGTATDLLHELVYIASELNINNKDKRFPKDPGWLWKRIKEVKPNLRILGIDAEKDDSNRTTGRKIILRKSQSTQQPSGHNDNKFTVSTVLPSKRQYDNNDTKFLDLTEDEIEKAIDEYLGGSD